MSTSRIALEMNEKKTKSEKKSKFLQKKPFPLETFNRVSKETKTEKTYTLWNDIKHENCFQAQND